MLAPSPRPTLPSTAVIPIPREIRITRIDDWFNLTGNCWRSSEFPGHVFKLHDVELLIACKLERARTFYIPHPTKGEAEEHRYTYLALFGSTRPIKKGVLPSELSRYDQICAAAFP